MKKEMLIKCYHCGNQYPAEQMRYGPNGITLVCINCLERKKAEPIKIISEKAEKKPQQKISEKDKTQYRCSSCNYTFSRASHSIVINCPYCSKPTIEKYKGIQSVIEEVDAAEEEQGLRERAKKTKKW